LSKINIQDIQGQNFIAFERGIPTREALEQIFIKYNVTTQIVMEFDNIETVKRAVEVDAGISIVPHVTVKYEAECGTLKVLEFADGIFERPIGILYKKGRKFSPAVQKFVDLLTKEWLLNNFYI
jgi:DNA-binding transcriptional LysR family regulator